MPRDPIPTLNNLSFVRTALLSSHRLDSRPLPSYRPFTLSFPSFTPQTSTTTTTTTTVRITHGKTTIIAITSASITPPQTNRPLEGILTLAASPSPLTSPSHEPHRPSPASQQLSRNLDKTLRQSRCVDLEALVLVPGVAVWNLRIDIHVLSDDGGVFEASVLGALAGLETFMLPAVDVKGGRVGRVWGLDEKEGGKIGVLFRPLGVQMAYLCLSPAEAASAGRDAEAQSVISFADPTAEETRVADGGLVTAVTRSGEVVHMSVMGKEVDAGMLVGWVRESVEMARWMDGVLREALKAKEVEDREVRGVREGMGRAVEERL